MKFLILIVSFVFLISCRETAYLSIDKNVSESKIPDSPKQVFTISGYVTTSQSYCGGARPTDAILQQITAPNPLSNATFYVKEGTFNDLSKNIFLEIKTDQEGKLNFKLPPGDYIIIEGARKDSTYYHSVLKKYAYPTQSYSAADTTCMNNWLNGFLFQLKVVDADVNNVTWDIHHACWTDAPCIHYNGPKPP